MKRNFRLLVAVVALVAMVLTIASCDVINPGKSHEHTYSEDWSHDESGHWHAATCKDGEDCASAKSDEAAHTIEDGVCSVCGYEAPVEHTHTFVDGKCECGEDDPSYVPACTEHQWTLEETAPTCTEDGATKYICTVCNHTESQTVPALGHQEKTVEAVDPTCTEDGLSSGKVCTVCGETTKAQQPINSTGHDYQAGWCTVCGASDPNYSGPKTYVFDVQAFAGNGFGEGAKKDGESQVIADFFTVYYSAKTKIDTTKDKIWEDGYTVNPGYRLNFGGTTGVNSAIKNDDGEVIGHYSKNTIEFTTTGSSTIKIWWVAGGNGREVAIYNEKGEIVCVSYNECDPWTETVNGVEYSGNNAVKNGIYFSEFEIDKPGKYYIGTDNTLAAKKGGNIFFKVEVVDTPLVEKNLDVTVTDTYTWVDEYTITATEEGEYTFYLPAKVGAYGAAELKAFGPAFVDSFHPAFDSSISHSFTVTLKAGEEFKFYVGALATGDYTIRYRILPCKVDDTEVSVGDLTGVYNGADAWGNIFLTVTVDGAAGTVDFEYNHPLRGHSSTSATYKIVDGKVALYDTNGNALNPFSGILVVKNGVLVGASYNGADYTLSPAN